MMKKKSLSEFARLARLRRKIPKSLRERLGLRDDAAWLPARSRHGLLFAADVLVENVDFIRRQAKPELVGRKALAVNLSDLAAMGGVPESFVVSLGLPPSVSPTWVERLYDGMIALARKYGVVFAGGDLSRARECFISIAVLGHPASKKVVTRSGARPGDWIGVTGRLGGSLLGRHFRFTPRLEEGFFLARHANPHAMIDISDGLVQDLEHVLRASRTGATLDLDQIPVSAAARKKTHGKDALLAALTDGEDFELLFTVGGAGKKRLERHWKRKFKRLPLSWIGRITAGPPRIVWRRQGLRVRAPRLPQKGFQHF